MKKRIGRGVRSAVTRTLSELKTMKTDFVPPTGSSRLAIFADYILCVLKYHITYSEYFKQYKFYALSKYGRREYITLSQAHRIQKRLNRNVRDLFWHKDRFLQKFTDFTNRQWMSVTEASLDEFKRFCQVNKRFIAKPVTGTCGTGIKVINVDDKTDIEGVFKELSAGNYIVEEYLSACPEIAEFHPGSLNTIRVVTYYNGNRFHMFGAFIRLGVSGSFVDNAHAGGIFAHIDPETGIVTSEGTNINGARFALHPNSRKQIVGFQIPMWGKIGQTCMQASIGIPEAKIVGWDIAVTKDYSVVIIEGNHMPDFDLMQSAARKGVRKEFLELTSEI